IRAATVARVDMALVAGLTLLFGAWLVALSGGRCRLGAGLFAMAAAGPGVATLANGPLALVLPALAARGLYALRRHPRLLRRLDSIPVTRLADTIPGIRSGAAFAKQGCAFFDILPKENRLLSVNGEIADTGHSHGFICLPLVGLVGLLPWTPLLPLAGAPLAD